MAKKTSSAFMKELKTWTKPAKGFGLTVGRAAYHLGKVVVRHPIKTIAGSLLLGAAKLAWKHPISTTAAWLIGKKILKTRPGLKFSKHRQFDKRGRKFI